ncbi:hypothetical protein WG906_06085 [Pedobacter sp. P351]|uniref:hypothetical protein n=1 Tax=Pedobacter superstes TaxID=3133441 RepID=UPI0030A2C7DB
MKVKILIALGILIVVSVFIYKTVSPKNEQYYTRHFHEKEQGFAEIKNYLLEKYASNSASRGKVRLIFINPNKAEKTLKIEIIDPSLVTQMEDLNISDIHLENEASSCYKNFYFDKIYFSYFKSSHRPTVDYVYSICDPDTGSYSSDKVTNRFLKNNWGLLIDNSF